MMLVIAEKNQAGKRIALALAGKKIREVWIGKERNYLFEKDNKKWVILPLRGHIYEIDFKKNRKWDLEKIKDLVYENIELKEKERGIIKLLESIGKKAEEVIVATDYDREGELIGLEAVVTILKSNKNVKIKRAKFSSLDFEEVKKAFSNLINLDKHLADSADARRKIDLLWGAIFTRYLTLTEKKGLLSVGRVQTPTLKIIYEREKEIENFVPEKYYKIEIVVDGKKLLSEMKFKSKKEAEKKCKEIESITLNEKEETKEILKPLPLNTNEFLKLCTKKGIKPKTAMSLAEKLYLKGYITYPRTDNQAYDNSFLKKVVKRIEKAFPNIHKKWEKIKSIPRKGKESKDHPPIMPTGVFPKTLSTLEKKVYFLILNYFFATISKNAKVKITKQTIETNNGLLFKHTSTKIVDPGFLLFFGKVEEEEKIKKPELEKKKVRELTTKPPKRYSFSEILSLMEKNGLGTKSTRHEILHKLAERGFIDGNTRIKLTEKGRFLIEKALEKVEDITKAELTEKIEEELKNIEEGKKMKEEVLNKVRKRIEEIIEDIL